jgi:hypothetical protein
MLHVACVDHAEHTRVVTSAGSVTARGMRARRPLPRLSFDLAGALLATAVAVLAYVVAVSMGTPPPRQASVLFFAAAPLCALVALPVLVARSRRDGDQMLGWFAAGLGGCATALVLQLAGYPTVAAAGGLLGTSGQSSALLYLLFHVALYGGAIVGALGAGGGPRRWVVAAGVLLAVLVAADAVPAPELLRPDQTFTPLLTGIQYGVAAMGALALWLWVRAAGRTAAPLRGWVGITLSVSVYEIILNAIAGRRFDAIWWSSLSLRALGFAVLAAGCMGYLLVQLNRLERYSDAELGLRETELEASLGLNERLLENARSLGVSSSPADVSAALQASIERFGLPAEVELVYRDPVSAQVVAIPGGPGSPGGGTPADPDVYAASLATRSALFLDTAADVARHFGRADVGWGAAMAVLPLPAPSPGPADARGVLVVSRSSSRPWSDGDRELLSGLADQAGPALARAVQAAREHAAAQTLQRALLPRGMPVGPEVTVAAHYLPAVRGDRVGGDWYDAWRLPDGRVCLVVGDVVGHGLEAAATMGRLRAAIRALAQVDPAPGVLLTRLDAVEATERTGMVATILCAVVDPARGTALVARAGHLPLLIARPGQDPMFLLDGGAPPIGCAGTVGQVRVDLARGSVAVLYTDGLVERRDEPIDDGLAQLSDALAGAMLRGDSADAIAGTLVELRPRPAADDVALLVVRVDAG